jgi:hypothetical protein
MTKISSNLVMITADDDELIYALTNLRYFPAGTQVLRNLESGLVNVNGWVTMGNNSNINLDGGTLQIDGDFNFGNSTAAQFVFSGGILVDKAVDRATLQTILASHAANIAFGNGYTLPLS